MTRTFKTSKKSRAAYTYYDADGNKQIELKPGENKVTEADIALLHSMDDKTVDENRRYEYWVPVHLDACQNSAGEAVGDSNTNLADFESDPEIVCIADEDECTYQQKLEKLKEALKSLTPEQQSLFERIFIQGRSNSDVAHDEKVSETAIRKRLKNMYKKLEKFL